MRHILLAMRFDLYRYVSLFHQFGSCFTSTRQISTLLLLGFIICSGCANMPEKRTISAFQMGLEAGDMQSLQANATQRFANKALRHPQADDSIAQLKLPDGEFKILDVEDVSETEKKVTVGFGKENKRKILYRLVSQGDKKQWKVDDIYLRQRSGKKTIAMPISEQMDVLLSSREFFESWSMGDRQRVLDTSSPALAQELEKLPPSVLAYNISLIVGKAERSKSFRPEAHINGSQAVVKINRSHGTIEVSMKQTDAGWQVSDLALKGRNKESRIDSLLKRVKITNQAMVFLDAWQQNDKPKLKQIVQEKFYTAGLAPANLSDVALPSALEVESKVDVKISESRADVILNNQKQTVQITLKEQDDATQGFIITDVTLYDMKHDKTQSLVSALTARPVAELFMIALKDRDSKMLQYNSTHDFHSKTWDRASPQTLAIVPFPMKSIASARVVNTRFQGEVTYVDFETSTEQFVVELHDQGGRVLVDDVVVTVKTKLGHPEKLAGISLKNQLAAVVPVYELAANIHKNQTRQTLRLVTDDFYNRVFSLTKSMPDAAYVYLSHVSSAQPEVKYPGAVTEVNAKTKGKKLTKSSKNLVIEFDTSDSAETLVSFYGQNSNMMVKLIEEDGLLRIHDALINSSSSEVAQNLKQTMRMELAQRRTDNMIRTASAESRQPSRQPSRSQKMPLTLKKTRQPVMPLAVESPGRKMDRNQNQKPLKNALYEQYETAKPIKQIQPAGFNPVKRNPQPIELHNKQPVSTPQPLKLNAQEHLLLKPIPLQ